MRRKTAVAGFSYLAGMFFASFFVSSTIFLFVAVIFLACAVVLIVNPKSKNVIATVLISMAVGMAIYGGFEYFEYGKVTAFDEKTAEFSGEIIDYEYVSNDIMRVTAKGEIVGKNTKITAFLPYESCSYYDKISFSAEFERIENDIAFNSLDYNKAEGIYLNALNCKSVKITDGGFSILKIIRNYSDDVYLEIMRALPDDVGAFLGAMLCGDKSQIDSTSKSNLYNIGIGHIFSVSGTHLVVISFVFGYIFGFLKLSRKQKAFACEMVILVFTVFAGMSSSVLRAAVMMTVFNLSNVFRRIPDSATTLAICGILLTVFSPEKIRSASFLLSMSGAFSLSVVAPQVSKTLNFKGVIKPVFESLLSCVCVWIVSLPFVMMYFNKVSVIAPLVNVVFVPFCTLALVLTVLATLFGFVGVVITPLLEVAGFLVKIVIIFADFVGKQWFVSLSFGNDVLRIAIVSSIFFILLVLVLKRKTMAVIKAVLLCVIAICVVSSASVFLNRNKLEIYMLNYKNSCAIVLNKNQKAVIIDNGGENSDAVVRLLEYEGIVEVTGIFTFENTYSAQSAYNSKLNFCEFDYKDCHNINETERLSFYGAEIYFDESFLTINYGDEILEIPYEFDSEDENGEIYRVITNGKETDEKRRFGYAFL